MALTWSERVSLLTSDIVYRHLPEPGGLHTLVRDGGADQPVLAEALRVDDVLSGLGCDVLAEFSCVAWEKLAERNPSEP